LRYVEPVHITNVRVQTFDVLTDNPRLEVDVWVRNQTDEILEAQLGVLINDERINADGSVKTLAQKDLSITLPANHETRVTRLFDGLPHIELWSIDNPNRYGCGTQLLSNDGKTIDDNGAFPFGFREAEFRDDGFYLNGERVFLRGLNRHQLYPYIGAAAPQRLQELDADIIKDMGCNIVRTSHYPQSKHFLNRCDEIGLLVFEEIPGWQ
jgi:beta-galactosidase